MNRESEALVVTATRIKAETNASAELVSIGLPTYNRAGTLRTAIESVLSQDYKNIELVISDNASTDLTHEVCEEYAKQDARVRYIRQPSNCGMAANFREVLFHSRGDYFLWLSDDDSLTPHYVARCLQVLASTPEASLVCGKVTYFENDAPAFDGVSVNLRQDSPIERVLGYYRQVNDNGTFYGLTRRKTIASLPLRNALGGDWLLIASLAYLGNIITCEDVVVRRSSRGASSDVRDLAKSLGLSTKRLRQPHLTIAANIVKDILLRSPAFRDMGLLSRVVLAARSALIVCRRFVRLENPLSTFSNRVLARLNRILGLS